MSFRESGFGKLRVKSEPDLNEERFDGAQYAMFLQDFFKRIGQKAIDFLTEFRKL